jgi:hypothetical protein
MIEHELADSPIFQGRSVTPVMDSWMKRLAKHYERTRADHPDDRLMILFDIDGTILDMRWTILYVLQGYDRSRGTSYFADLRPDDIHVHENHVDVLLREMRIPRGLRGEILAWYLNHRWSLEAILHSHRPFRGVMEVIRWFQMQPNTYVGLNTGRPESLRIDTLHSLNELGQEYRVCFAPSQVHMNPRDWGQGIPEAKVAGLWHFQDAGYRVFAVVDNEPENLRAMAAADTANEIQMLHASTIFTSQRSENPPGTVEGEDYDITELIPERSLFGHVQFVWHGVNDDRNLRQFLASEVHWAELDVREDPATHQLVLRHDSFTDRPRADGETLPFMGAFLDLLHHHGKGIKLDLKQGAPVVPRVLRLVAQFGIPDSQLWFNGTVESFGEHGFRAIARQHPRAILQCPVDFLAPLIVGAPAKARETLEMFRDWGVNRLSVSWSVPFKNEILDQMERWGFEVNIYNVPDLESFLQAALLSPRSVTSDFNFPKWEYYGTGLAQKQLEDAYPVSVSAT